MVVKGAQSWDAILRFTRVHLLVAKALLLDNLLVHDLPVDLLLKVLKVTLV